MKKEENEEKTSAKGVKRKMFKSMKMYLKNKLEDSKELSKIRNKLYVFLNKNPDVDQYLCDNVSKRETAGLMLGFLIGFIISAVVCLVLFFIAVNQWKLLGYLHFPPGFRGWW